MEDVRAREAAIPVVLEGGGDEGCGMSSPFHGINTCAPSNLHSPSVTSTSILLLVDGGGHVAADTKKTRAVTKSSASDTL